MERFQSTVRILGNQMFVRHYLALNYPHTPQLLGIQMHPPVTPTSGGARLIAYLIEQGFRWDEKLSMWIVERAED